MKLITEVVEDVKVIEEAKEDGKKNLYIEGIFLQGNLTNRNGRRYNTEVLDKEVQRYVKENVEKNRAYGELGHPNGPTINLDRVSHLIESLKRNGDNFIGRAKISSTPMGNIVRGLLEDGANLGVSSRGMGSVKESKQGVMEVQDDFYLATAADIVADPSAPDAFVNGIMEGVEWVWEHNKIVQKTAEEIQEEIEQAARAKRLTQEAKFKSFEKFLNSISKS
jgi:hypothetical protein